MQGSWVPSLVAELRSHMPCGQAPKKNKQANRPTKCPLYPPSRWVPALSPGLPSQASSWKSRPPLADFTSSFSHPQQAGVQQPPHSLCSCQGHADLCIHRSNGSSAGLPLLDLPQAFGTCEHCFPATPLPLNLSLHPAPSHKPLPLCPMSTSKSVSEPSSLLFPPKQTIFFYFFFFSFLSAFKCKLYYPFHFY